MALDSASYYDSGFSSYLGKRCEVRVLEERIGKRGELEVVVKGEFNPSEVDPDGEYALVTKKAFDKNHALTKTILRVNSPQLLHVFRTVVGFYPTIATSFDDPFEMEAPFAMLYHYWQDLEAFKAAATDDTTRMHLSLLLEYMEYELGTAKRHNENMVKRGFINYGYLWTIFKPGEIQHTSNYGHPRLMKLEKTYYDETQSMGPYLEVQCSYVDYNGTSFGQAQHVVQIREKGNFGMGCAAKITKLEIHPRKFVKEQDSLEAKLLLRGQRFLQLKTVQVMHYAGKYEYLRLPPGSWYHPNMRYYDGVWLPIEDTGRVILDRKTFAEDYESEQVDILPAGDEDASPDKRHGVLTPEGGLDPVLCPSFVYGFSLQRKVWCRFYIDNLTSIEWKRNAMEALLLPSRQKDVLNALVSAHRFPTEAREESQLKGKGLVMLLHGTPGSGKTLTAETAAETTRKGLLSITMGELRSGGDEAEYFELKLREFLRLATTWQAVVLIDEADVFLEHRLSGPGAESGKNALVAVFLRHLEYFHGIIFLTSNRVDVFDAAMKSRIHLALQYKSPGLNTRLQLWTQRLEALDPELVDLDMDEALGVVGKVEMNGREISNSLNTALTLARHEGGKLRLDHLEMVVHVWQDFNVTLEKLEEDYEAMPRQDSIVSTFRKDSAAKTAL